MVRRRQAQDRRRQPRQRRHQAVGHCDGGAQPARSRRPRALNRRCHAHQSDSDGKDQPGGSQAGQRDPERQTEKAWPGGTVGRPQRQHRRRHPRQAPVTEQQTPMPLQEPFTDVRIPDRQRDRHELAADTGLWQHFCDKSSRTPARQPQCDDEHGLHHDAAVDAVRGQRDREVLRRCPWSRDQSEGAIGQIRPRRGHRVALQQIAGAQQRRHDRQRQRQCVAGTGAPHRPMGYRPHAPD